MTGGGGGFAYPTITLVAGAGGMPAFSGGGGGGGSSFAYASGFVEEELNSGNFNEILPPPNCWLFVSRANGDIHVCFLVWITGFFGRARAVIADAKGNKIEETLVLGKEQARWTIISREKVDEGMLERAKKGK